MLLLISSNSSRRYGDDIVRALAHPRGTEFQFRYGLKYFDLALLHRVKTGALSGETALIVFMFTDKTARTITLVACRAVTIKRSEVLGTSCILTLIASDYVVPPADADLRAKLTPREVALLPVWATDPDYPAGKYVIEVAAAVDRQLAAPVADELAAFEATALALSPFPTFDKTSKLAFYAIRSIETEDDWRPRWWRTAARSQASYSDGRYQLASGYRYDLGVYTFTPSGGQVTGGATKLMVDSDEVAVRFTSSKEITLDSRYDLNRFTLTTDQVLDSFSAGIRVAVGAPIGTDGKLEQRCDIALSVRFAGWRFRGITRMVLIAIGTAAPAIVGIAFKDKMSIGIGAVMFGGALVAGWASVFLGKKG